MGSADRDTIMGAASKPLELDTDVMWKAALSHAEIVVAQLRASPNFNSEVLLKVITDLTNGGFTPEDIIAVYHQRMRAGS
jgi:hypothetical protein